MEHIDINMGDIFSAVPQTQDLMNYWEFCLSLLPSQMHYNLTLFMTLLSCKESTQDQQPMNSGEETQDENREKGFSFLDNALSFFNFDIPPDETIVKPPHDNLDNCESVMNLNTTTSLSPAVLAFSFIAASVMLLICIYSLCFCLKSKKASSHEFVDNVHESSCNHVDEDSKKANSKENQDCFIGQPLAAPLYVKTGNINLKQDKGAKCESVCEKWESLFEFTVQRYLKELDVCLGISSISSFELAGTASLPASQDNVSCLTSPRLKRRNLSQTSKVVRSPSLTDGIPKHVDINYAKSWITYEMFKTRMCWQFPVINLDNVNISQISQDDKNLAMVLQFLHQYCPINPRQWDIAVSIVNYSLFILENELRSLCNVTQDSLSISGFQVSGSAADGTLIGCADRFDMLLVLDFFSCPELMVLHNNFSDEIPPGHIVLGVKEQQAAKEGASYVRKGTINGSCASYLQTQAILDRTETMLKKALLRLNRNHKGKLDSLPFSFQMSQNKRLVLTFDTRLLHSFGLGIGEISVRITPAFDLSVAEYCLLPSLFAVPLIKNSACLPSPQISIGNGAMSRLFRTPGISDLLWLVHTENLHLAIVNKFGKSLNSDHVRSCYKECLMVLKALFSPSHHNKLLNKGEVDSYILKTVVSFLLQESPSSAWGLENLAHRFSDAVHFLRSAYENAWLPELCIHNPHLSEKMPCLKVMCHILQGRQRNLLAHMKNQNSLKVLDFVTQRLQETRLSHSVNDYFSSDMWEYEFFMFG